MTFQETTITGQRFQLGRVVITRGALTHCEDHDVNHLDLLIRHASGDFGSVGHLDNAELTRAELQHGAFMTDDGLTLNAVAVANKQGTILSIYSSSAESEDSKIWIQTLLCEETNATYTTLLLPSEY